MPNATVKSYAEKSGKSVAQVEKIWEDSKKEADKKFKTHNSEYWAYVNATVKKKLGLDKKPSAKKTTKGKSAKPLYNKW